MKNKTFLFRLNFNLRALLTMTVVAATCTGLSAETVLAQIPGDGSASPEVFSEPGAKLLITAVNFKNKTADWVEFYYESPTRKPFNIKNFQFQDDKIFKKIGEDYWISSNEHYVLQFKGSDEPGADNQSGQTLSTARTGLTATTEQIALLDPNGKIIDALCWSSASPTSDETKDMEELFQNEGWVSPNPLDCFPSEKVSTNQSLVRTSLEDTDSVSDWTVSEDASPGSPALNPSPVPLEQRNSVSSGSTQTSSTKTIPPSQTATPKTVVPKTATKKTVLPSSEKSATKKTQPKPAATKTSTTKSSTKKKSAYKNGDASPDIIISEIFPHAATDDRTNEWIELSNTGDRNVNLGNWQVDDAEGGSKPYVLPDTLSIPARSALLIKASDSRLSLSNTKDQVRLFDPSGKLLQTVEFEEAPKAQSYAWITVTGEDGSAGGQWLWENQPTPGEPNPPYLELGGTVTADAEFGETYSFPMQTDAGRQYSVIFNEALVAGPLAKASFIKGARIKITGIPSDTAPSMTQEPLHELQLKKYEILGESGPNPGSGTQPASPWMFVGLVPPGGAGFWYLLKKIRKIYGKI